MKYTFTLIIILFIFSCKKATIQVSKTNKQSNSVFNVIVIDRESDAAALTWSRPANIDSNEYIAYKVVLGKDTIPYNQIGFPFLLTNLDTIAYHGKVIATGSLGQTAIDTFYVAPFYGYYYAQQYDNLRLEKVTIGYSPYIPWAFYSSYDSGYGPAPTPIIHGDTVFTCSYDNIITVRNNKTGTEIWSSAFSGDVSKLLYNSGIIYITVGASDGEHLYSINSKTGAINWDFKYNQQSISSPIITNKTIFITAGLYLLSIDAKSGKQNWQYYVTDSQTSTLGEPCTDGTNVYFGSQAPKVYGVDAHTGKLNWSYTLNQMYFFNNTSTYNGVVIQCLDNNTIALDSKTGSLLWEIPQSTQPAFNGDTVFIGYSHQVHALHLKTGVQIWQSSLSNYDLTGEMMKVGNIIFSGYGGSLQSVNYTASGQASYRLKTSNGEALFFNGTPATDYHDLGILPVIVVKGKVYYDASSPMSRSF